MPTKKEIGLADLINADDAPPLTAQDLNHAEVFEGDVFMGRGRGRPKSSAAKEQISVRLDPDVLARLRQNGPGWQSRINTLLREALGITNGAAERAA